MGGLTERVLWVMAFMWLVGYDIDERTPDHSDLSKARRRFGVTTFAAFFMEIVRQCERAGLVQGNLLYADSMLIQANASLGSVGARALVEQQVASVEEHLAALWREHGDATVEGEAPLPSVVPFPSPAAPAPGAAPPSAETPSAETPAGPTPDLARQETGGPTLGPHPLGPEGRTTRRSSDPRGGRRQRLGPLRPIWRAHPAADLTDTRQSNRSPVARLAVTSVTGGADRRAGFSSAPTLAAPTLLAAAVARCQQRRRRRRGCQ